MILFHKQPGETLDYDIVLTDELPDSDTIINAVASVSPAGLTFGTTAINNTTKIVKQWISGGSDQTEYQVTMTITTAEGRVIEEEFKLKVKEI